MCFEILMAGADFPDVHRFAALLEGNGVSKKDHIAVFMTNSPEMVVTVLALSKLGAVAALVNINLRGLAHKTLVSMHMSTDSHQMTP